MNAMGIVRGAKFAAVIFGALVIAGCAKHDADPTNAMASAAVPGSQQDFVVNVGDRVFFDTDSSDLSVQARATLDKQAEWLSHYSQYAFTIEGHADDLLRQGTSGRSVRRYFLLVAEPSRRDGARSEFVTQAPIAF
jgi:peptidoglycan-associated lipoprotein